MKIKAREQIKLLLSMRNMTITELAQLLTEKTGKKYTFPSLSSKLIRGSLSYNEFLEICEILDFSIKIEDKM